ncbi:tetratricopeptide repeat protein [Longibacter sp.]|uniref:tetratricopeptide repeat protein n=1 Tax=Longibacter sp. TaxID=2045415 RepID=UPI003EBA7803
MTPDEWKRVQRLFHDALAIEETERHAFLREACENPDLREQVKALLEADARDGDRLETPLLERAGNGVEKGARIGPYTVREELGRGGMGRVFLAERTDVGSRVALKVVRNAVAAPDRVERFLVERRILARLEHPNIARLLDAGVTPDDTPFLAMEYVEGETITAYCDRRHLSVRERLELFTTVGTAVAHAHRNLVVHRDLKPSNVYVSTDGRVKLLDFGIAKLLEDNEAGLTRTGRPILTPGYAAPEQVSGDTVTTATDVYGLGVVLYELLTGVRPHDDPTSEDSDPRGVERRVLESEPRPPSAVAGTATATDTGADLVEARSTTRSDLRRTLRGDLDTIILKALRKEPDRRYDGAAKLVDDIQCYLEGRPVSARPDSVRYRATRFVQRHAIGVAASAAVILAIVVGLGLAVWQGQRAQQAQARAEEAQAQVEQELAKSEAVTTFLVDLFEASDPDQNPGLDLTARTLLQRGEERVDTLRNQPLVQAELQRVIGRVYTDLGEYDRADQLLMASLMTQREASGDTPEVAQALFDLGVLRWRQSNFREAEDVLRQAYEMERELHGTEVHPDVAGALNALALSISKQGRLAEAVPMQERMVEISSQLPEEADEWTAMSQNNLAVLYQNLERYAQAVPLAEDMLSFQRSAHDPPHPQIAMGHSNLGGILTDALRAGEGIPHLQTALDMKTEIYDPGHPRIAVAHHNLAEALYRDGQFEAADSLFSKAIDLTAGSVGVHHAAYGDVLHDYGLFLTDRGDLPRARDTLRTALDVRREGAGLNETRVARTLGALADLDLMEETTIAAQRAEERLRRALEIFEERFADPHPYIYVLSSRLGRALVIQERYDEAEPLLRDAYDGLIATSGVPTLDVAPTTSALATLYAARGETEYADTWRRR